MKTTLKYLHHPFLEDGRHRYPYLSVSCFTYECKFRCRYCSVRFGRPSHALDDATLLSVKAIAILQRIRGFCNRIVITVGEPTLHRGLDAVLEAMPGLGFALEIDDPPPLLVDECTIFFEGVRTTLSSHH